MTYPDELSPLDQIRQTEAEVTRRIAAAREAAEKTVEKARGEAAKRKAAAREAGRLEGQAQLKENLARAEEEARALVAQAHHQADELRRRGRQRMHKAVQFAICVVLGLEGEGRRP